MTFRDFDDVSTWRVRRREQHVVDEQSSRLERGRVQQVRPQDPLLLAEVIGDAFQRGVHAPSNKRARWVAM